MLAGMATLLAVTTATFSIVGGDSNGGCLTKRRFGSSLLPLCLDGLVLACLLAKLGDRLYLAPVNVYFIFRIQIDI